MGKNTPLTFTVRLEKKDYLDVWKASPVRYVNWILFLIAAFYLYWAFAIIMNDGYSVETSSTIIAYCGVASFALIAALILPRLRTRLAFRGPIFLEERKISVEEGGLSLESALVSSNYHWGAFTVIKETKHSFVFYFSPFVGFLVPKRCFSSAEDSLRLREFIARYFNDRKRLRN